MLKHVSVEGNDVRILDAVVAYVEKDNSDSKAFLKVALEKTMSSNKNFLFIFKYDKENPAKELIFADFYMTRKDNGDISDVAGGTGGPDSVGNYLNAGLVKSISFFIKDGDKTKRIYVDYYLGEKLQ